MRSSNDYEVAGLRGASAIAGAADAFWIDLGPGLEVIDTADAVPDFKAGGVPSQRDAAHADLGVSVDAPELRPAVLAHVLPSLALIDGVEDERRHAVEGQQGAHRLIGVVSLGFEGMAARHQHAGIRRLETLCIGQKQQPGNVVLRLALEDDLLDAVALPRDRADDAGIQRGSLGQAADGADERIVKAFFVSGNLFRRLSFLIVVLPAVDRLLHLAGHITMHHEAGRSSSDRLRRHVQILAVQGRRRQQKHEDRRKTVQQTLHVRISFWRVECRLSLRERNAAFAERKATIAARERLPVVLTAVSLSDIR